MQHLSAIIMSIIPFASQVPVQLAPPWWRAVAPASHKPPQPRVVFANINSVCVCDYTEAWWTCGDSGLVFFLFLLMCAIGLAGPSCAKTSRRTWRTASCSSSTFWLLSCKVTHLLDLTHPRLSFGILFDKHCGLSFHLLLYMFTCLYKDELSWLNTNMQVLCLF